MMVQPLRHRASVSFVISVLVASLLALHLGLALGSGPAAPPRPADPAQPSPVRMVRDLG